MHNYISFVRTLYTSGVYPYTSIIHDQKDNTSEKKKVSRDTSISKRSIK